MVIKQLEFSITNLTESLGPDIIEHSDRYQHLKNLLTITKTL